jgi:hypothetical protein
MTERSLQAVLAVAAAYQIVTGAMALIAPDTFFDEIGRYGVENSHYVGDVGAFMLAAGIALAICVVRPSWRVPILWTGAIWFGFHALNHAFDTGEARSDARGWLDTILLALAGVGSGWLATVSANMQDEQARAR